MDSLTASIDQRNCHLSRQYTQLIIAHRATEAVIMRRVLSASRQVAGACRRRVTRGRATHRLRRENLFPFHVGVEPATVRVLTEPDCCRINLRVPCEYSSAPRETLIRLSFASSPSVRSQCDLPFPFRVERGLVLLSMSCSSVMSLWTFCFFHRHHHVLLTSLP